MHFIHRTAALFVLGVALHPIAMATELRDSQRPVHERAVQAFRERHWAAAYGRFVQLADAGHVPSAEMALLMHQQGKRLFGSDWSASPDQQRRWNALVINHARQRTERDDLARAE